MTLKEKFEECNHEFLKYENKSNEAIETANTILLKYKRKILIKLSKKLLFKKVM